VKKGKDKTKVEKAVDVLFEEDLDLSTVLGKGGLLKEFRKAILERALAAEMEDHLGYKPYERTEGENARNGSYAKSLITEHGTVDLNIPRDREGDFEPIIIPKKQTRITGLDQKILSLYAKGMSLSDIKQSCMNSMKQRSVNR